MISMDRTVKLLLTSIVVLLAALVFRNPASQSNELPILRISPSAQAAETATTTTPTSTTTSYGYRVAQISIINIPTRNRVKEVFTIDGTGCFGIRYDHHVEVYSVVQTTNEAKIRTIQAN